MSDLISRSALIEEIKGFTDISEEYFKNPKLLIEIIENTKTAYDVEKVVAKIKRRSSKGYRDIDGDYVPPMIETEDAIDIVRGGRE